MVDLPVSPGPAGVYVVSTLVPLVATIAVALRFLVRRRKNAGLGSDDWTICVAMLIMWAMSGMMIAGTANDVFGHHTAQDPITHEIIVTPKEHQVAEQVWVIMVVNGVVLGIIKLSVILLYRRLFTVSRSFKITSIIQCIVVALWSLGFTFATLFQCRSRPASYWTSDRDILKFCDNTSAEIVVFCVLDIVTDLMILITPIPIIFRLHLSLPQRIGVSAIFALGFLSVAAGAVRTVITAMMEYGTELGARDLRGANTNIAVWSLVEIGVAITAACLPTLRPLFSGTLPGSFIGSVMYAFSLRSHEPSSVKHRGYKVQSKEESESTDLRPLRKKGERNNYPSSFEAGEGRREDSNWNWGPEP